MRSRENPENNRPISLTSIPRKIMELVLLAIIAIYMKQVMGNQPNKTPPKQQQQQQTSRQSEKQQSGHQDQRMVRSAPGTRAQFPVSHGGGCDGADGYS